MEIPKILYDQRAQFNDYGHQGRRHALHYDHAEASFRMLEFGTALWIGIYFSEALKDTQEVPKGQMHSQHVKFAEVGVDKPGILVHPSHILNDLQVQLPSLGLRQLGVFQEWRWPRRKRKQTITIELCAAPFHALPFHKPVPSRHDSTRLSTSWLHKTLASNSVVPKCSGTLKGRLN